MPSQPSHGERSGREGDSKVSQFRQGFNASLFHNIASRLICSNHLEGNVGHPTVFRGQLRSEGDEDLWFEQKLDHFEPISDKTWMQVRTSRNYSLLRNYIFRQFRDIMSIKSFLMETDPSF